MLRGKVELEGMMPSIVCGEEWGYGVRRRKGGIVLDR